ncbi:hypothetical protein FJU11_03340 [Pararhizobium mangrovi]|uniref:Uncharacterized protein n=2 Tax=Pararhizobium mangrovi TaxID=2590452 RepID=A0A506UF06_9HYPH|nr:hypothetical protein FJU11_03340 [Pararhizobium mangrovi]
MHRVRLALTAMLVAALTIGSVAQAQEFVEPQGDHSTADTAIQNFELKLPGIDKYQQRDRSEDTDEAGIREIPVIARLTKDGAPIGEGLEWRVFAEFVGPDGRLPLVTKASGGSPALRVAPGTYFVNAAFGHADVTRKIVVPDTGAIGEQAFVLHAGGLMLDAVAGDHTKIPADELSFSIYRQTEDGTAGKEHDAKADRTLVARNVPPEKLIRLAAGTYHVVSDYGHYNAVIGADIRVEAGKMTRATIQHRAAALTLKLVAKPGGEGIANTAWSILTQAGDVVGESVGAYASLVLAEGNYTAVARNKGHIYERDFKVEPGKNREVEVLLDQSEDADKE